MIAKTLQLPSYINDDTINVERFAGLNLRGFNPMFSQENFCSALCLKCHHMYMQCYVLCYVCIYI